MTDTPIGQNKNAVYILAAVAVVLLASIVFLVWNANRVPGVKVGAGPSTGTTAGTTGGATGAGTTGGTSGGAAAAGPFDPKTATKVPAGQTPEQFVKAYLQAVVDGKYADAYKMLPVDKQASYGSAASYEEQVKAYGITGYDMGKPVTKGDEVDIVAAQNTPQMPITYTWTLKKVGDSWYVKARTMGGTVN